MHADCGFDITDNVAIMGAELKIPAFTKGRKRYHGKMLTDRPDKLNLQNLDYTDDFNTWIRITFCNCNIHKLVTHIIIFRYQF